MAALGRLAWFGIAAGAGMTAGSLSRRVLAAGWSRIEKAGPPSDPARAPLGKAALWTALLGAGAGLTKLLLLRGSAAAWQRATGSAPPV